MKHTRTYNHIDRRSLIAIHLLLQAIKNRARAVNISKDALQKFFKVKRVSRERLKDFANSMKPYFPSSTADKDYRYFPSELILFLTEGDIDASSVETLTIRSIPSHDTITKELGLEVVNLQTERVDILRVVSLTPPYVKQ